MISRLSATAAVFAVIATASLAFAVEARADRPAAHVVAAAKATPTTVIELPRVEVVGRRAR